MTLVSIHTRTLTFVFFEKALLIGINYAGTSSALRGCINDVHNIRELLVSEGFQPKDMAPNAGKSSFKVISCSKCTRVLTRENETCQRSSSLTINVIACSSRSPNSPKSSIQ